MVTGPPTLNGVLLVQLITLGFWYTADPTGLKTGMVAPLNIFTAAGTGPIDVAPAILPHVKGRFTQLMHSLL
jgi:hypothetical protein